MNNIGMPRGLAGIENMNLAIYSGSVSFIASHAQFLNGIYQKGSGPCIACQSAELWVSINGIVYSIDSFFFHQT